MRLLLALLSALIVLPFSGCGYNTIQSEDEEVKAAWSEVLNQYQRRADLVPNLVNTVKGYAGHEKEVLEAVTNARSRVGQVTAAPDLTTNPEAMKQFAEAQASMSGALSRLLVVAENYPQLKADTSFRDLQAQLEGTENRITVARNRYIQAVQRFNTLIRQFPTNLTAKVFGYQTKPNFSVANEQEVSKPPTVAF